jgi:hypothetical protein
LCLAYQVEGFKVFAGSTGLYFPYTLGALGYIKTLIKPRNIEFTGISGGSWCSLVYLLEDKMNDHDTLWNSIIGNSTASVNFLDSKSMDAFHKTIAKNIKDKYTLKTPNIPLSIIATKVSCGIPQNIRKNKFDDFDDIINFCLCSSYIPLISGKKLYMDYQNGMYIDGALFLDKKNIQNNTIHIDRFVWNKRKSSKNILFLNMNISQKLFRQGWEDAKQNIELTNL